MTKNSNTPDDLFALQKAFAAHIRDGGATEAPGDIEDRRMKIYRDLFFNSLSSILSGNFPVLRELLDDGQWNDLIRDFYVEHRCHTPLFPELPREFLQYLQDERGTREGDLPFLLELAHYEWVELALSLQETDPSDEAADPEGDLLNGIPVLSSLAWPLSYNWPVHRISPDYQPESADEEPTHLLVWRASDDDVHFMQLNPVSRLLLAVMQEQPGFTGLQLLNDVAQRIQHPEPARLVEAGEDLLGSFRQKEIVLGSRPA